MPYLAIFLIKIPNEALDCRSLYELCVVYVAFLNCFKSWCITQCFKKLLVLNILDQYSSGVLPYLEYCKLPGIPVFQVSGKCLAFGRASRLPSTFKVFSHGASVVAYVIYVPWVYWQVCLLYSIWTFFLSENYQRIFIIYSHLFSGSFSSYLHVPDVKTFWLSSTLRKNTCSKICYSGRKEQLKFK